MAVFFGGRLWISPATMSVVDDSAMYNRNLSVGNVVAFIGRSAGGEPNKALRFGSAAEAKAALRSGPLLDAIVKAFDPSSETGGPATVVAVRVNPATRSSLQLMDINGLASINLTSSDFGQYTSQIRVKVEPGSARGVRLTTQLGESYYSQDNVAREAFSVSYSGAEDSGGISVSDSTVTLFAPMGTPVAEIELETYPTIDQLVDRINATDGFEAAVLGGSGNQAALRGLDPVTTQDVTEGFVVRADIQAVVDWFNGTAEGFVTASRAQNAREVPRPSSFLYLSGGSDGEVTNEQWSDAYEVLQGEDVQWVVPLSPDASIHAMNDAHCAYMSGVARMERRGIVGTASGTTDEAAVEAAKALNSDRTSLVHLGFYDYDASGRLVLFEPYMLAALLAGAFSGVNPGTALTNKSIKVRGLERKLRNPTDTDVLIQGGVLCVEETSTGFKVVKSISTWLNNDNYNRVEVSCGVALDFTARNVRNAVDGLRGVKGNPIALAQAVSRAESALLELSRPEPQGPGVLAGDVDNPPFKNVTASLEGDVLRVEFQCSPVIPVNYIPVSIFAVPYSGSASL